MPISMMIFDVEGTLVDCAAATLRSWQETLRSFGFAFSIDELQPHSGRDPREMLKAILSEETARQLMRGLLDAQGKHYREKYLPRVEPFPKVKTLFEHIKRSHRLIALATTCARDELSRYQRLTGVAELVDAAVCGDDVAHGKP